MASRKQESLVRTLGNACEERLLLDVVTTWRAFCEWFERQPVSMPKDGCPSVYMEDFLEGVALRLSYDIANILSFKVVGQA